MIAFLISSNRESNVFEASVYAEALPAALVEYCATFPPWKKFWKNELQNFQKNGYHNNYCKCVTSQPLPSQPLHCEHDAIMEVVMVKVRKTGECILIIHGQAKKLPGGGSSQGAITKNWRLPKAAGKFLTQGGASSQRTFAIFKLSAPILGGEGAILPWGVSILDHFYFGSCRVG